MTASSKPSQVFRFGVFELEVRARELRKQGVRFRLQEQPFLVLTFLLERAGDVVTREELREKLWPSSVYVDFDHGLNNAIARVREVLGDSAATPRFIETLPRLGYRFIYPVERRAEAAREGTAEATATAELGPVASLPSSTPRTRRLPRAAAAAVAFAVLLAALAALWVANRPTEVAARMAVPKAPSVAVLPFVNLSSDPENGFVADGLSEELVHMLAGIRGLKVAARTASFAFKGTRESPAAIAQKLNVTHLLEGSVRRSEERLRVTAQLIDAASGYHLWSEVFDLQATDILQIQEEIARAVASALEVKLVAADQQHLSKRLTSDAEAYRQYLIAQAQISWVFGRVDWAAVKRSFEAAIARDPQFAAAHAGLAHYYFNRAANDEEQRLGQAAADRAFALDPSLSEALSARANWDIRKYQSEGDYGAYQRAVQGYRRALDIDPANGQAAFHFARAVMFSEPDLALSLFERTIELDPMRISALAWAELLRSRHGDHESARQRLIELYNRNADKKFHIAIFLASLEESVGRLDEAVGYLREAQARGDVGETGLWALYMSLGDRAAARALVEKGAFREIGDAVRSSMDGRYAEALAQLERRRAASPSDHALDVPLARLALITGNAERARVVLEQRLPDIVSAVEPIDGRNVLPALDLAAAWLWTDRERAGRELLDRSVAFLGGPSAPPRSKRVFLRARAHALAGEVEIAQQTLDRAYEQGFRSTWAVDGVARLFEYIDPVDADPAFAALRQTAAYQTWLARVRADNARQLARLRTREATDPGRVAVVEGGE